MKRYCLISLLVLLASLALAPAQPLRGSYFFERSLLRGRLNPAFAPENGRYISVPLAGYADAEILSNAGLGNFLFPIGDKTYTFLSDKVDEESFYGRLPKEDPYLTARFETDLLGGGYRLSDKVFLTAGLSVSGYGQADVPLELLRLAKTGRSGATRSWSVDGLKVSFLTYATLSAGCSYDLGEWVPGLRVGGRLRLMTGLKSAVASLHRLDIRMDDDRFALASAGAIDLAGFSYTPDGGFSSERFRLRGFGAAIDLGAEYRLRFDGFVNGLNLSVSAGNLGKLSFGKATRLNTGGEASFEGFHDIGNGLDPAAALKQVTDDFTGLFVPGNAATTDLRFAMAPEIHAGAEIPFLDEILSLGLLYSRSLYENHLAISFNATPLKWLNLSTNYTFGPVGRMGFYAECIPEKYVGFFIGFEKASFKTNRNLLGIKNFTESLCLGLNVLL
ncbi:MAG: hypothetical protein IJ636_00300 [Bacteroidales bacterium]|nr:hypothetical protein [Bacteroidales bacterium]